MPVYEKTDFIQAPLCGPVGMIYVGICLFSVSNKYTYSEENYITFKNGHDMTFGVLRRGQGTAHCKEALTFFRVA